MKAFIVAVLVVFLGLKASPVVARSLSQVVNERVVDGKPIGWVPAGAKFLVPEPALVLTYHNGTILTGTIPTGTSAMAVPLYVIWYGNFTDNQKQIVRDFFASTENVTCAAPSVNSWWKMTGGYKDLQGAAIPPGIHLMAEVVDDVCSKGKTLVATDIEAIVVNSLTTFPSDANSVYIVLTSNDVVVEDFCTNQCGTHFATAATDATGGKELPYAWVGNPEVLCPGMCAWPFAKNEYNPSADVLVPPNGDVGIDGMVINIAAILAGTVTNPFNSGFYQGEETAPLEAASACTGMFGTGAYSGYAGEIPKDETTGSSYNAVGVNLRRTPGLHRATKTDVHRKPLR
ncbi:hypothetical protein R1flu_023073 [Riccia fluitans]|uniref:Uncharacterized protein n=1 Tax=Riccia fluitans TaxID=41844 RepID=A0ABD1XU04_9MARC